MSKKSNGGRVRRPPVATYRLQLNLNFTFRHATVIVPYLHSLGVSDLYASPYLQARSGSLHGYDISDHNRLNPELEPDDYDALMRALRDHRLGHLLDIVPNHMGIGETSNTWWMDVLENGPSSPFAPNFDIDWRPLKEELKGKVLLPVLGDQFGRILEKGELQIFFEAGRFRIRYHEQVFPVSPKSSSLVLRTVLDEMRDRCAGDDPHIVELESVVTALEHLPSRDRTDERSVTERRRESFVSRRRLSALEAESSDFPNALERALAFYNGTAGDPRSFDELERVLDDQPYRLAYWRVAAEEINYRRFFDINNLAGVRVELSEVFEATHRLILQLVSEGKVTGLRIDHPDGLFDPSGYLDRLQDEATKRAGEGPFYLLVEKILTGEEPLPTHWPIAGTVGYEFMTRLNGLYVAAENEAAMTGIYERFIGHRINFSNLIYEKKKLIMRVGLASELNVLAHLLNRLSENNRRFRDFTLGSLREALRETIASFPVYRTYIDAETGEVAALDREQIDRAIRVAIRRNRAMSRSIFGFVRDILLLEWPEELDPVARKEHALFVMKFQQLTGPVMAKGVEDTSFYIYNRLISLNEVGGEPAHFGISSDDLHAWLKARGEQWPHTMNNSTTHDTKRSEDVRARVNVLSEMPDEWERVVGRWAEMNSRFKSEVEGDPAPESNDEYLLYQTLVGAWPLEPVDPSTLPEFRDRIQRYMEKATREAKVHTSWIDPDEGYDDALHEFIASILTFGEGSEASVFLSEVEEFTSGVAEHGMVNGLSQAVVKLTAPGVPDVYQGQELWDFSLVDPDNRRPVDYALRGVMLEAIRGRIPENLPGFGSGTRTAADLSSTATPGVSDGAMHHYATELVGSWRDGRIKMFVTHLCLRLRQEFPEHFSDASYIPVDVQGAHAEHLFAFARQKGETSVLVVVPRLPRTYRATTGFDCWSPEGWEDTCLRVTTASGRWTDLFTGREITDDGEEIQASDLFGGFPAAVLIATP